MSDRIIRIYPSVISAADSYHDRDAFRSYVDARGWTVREAAAATGVSRQTVARCYDGGWHLETYCTVLAHLGLPFGAFLRHSEEK